MLKQLCKIATTLTGFTLCVSTITNAALADTTPNQSLASSALIAPTPNTKTTMPNLIPAPPNVNAKSFIVMDTDSGRIIAAKNMNMRLPPASLTKLMTLYVIASSLQSGHIHLDDKVHISEKAWKMGGSKMFVKANDNVPVRLLIQGIIVDSGNDACVAMAQFIGGNETSFAQLMNQTAQQLGMKNTHYVDSTGLPQPDHFATAYDLSILARAFINNFPQYYGWFNQKWFKYNNIRQPNRNRLLWRDPSVDGLKTGHTKSAGYCLIASAKRNNMRLLSVVMGTPTDQARNNDSQALLNYGFRFYTTHKLYDANQTITQARVWMGQQRQVRLGTHHPLFVTIPTGSYKQLKIAASTKTLTAPINKGEVSGQLSISLNGKIIQSVPLLALNSDAQGGLFRRLSDRISLTFTGKPH